MGGSPGWSRGGDVSEEELSSLEERTWWPQHVFKNVPPDANGGGQRGWRKTSKDLAEDLANGAGQFRKVLKEDS